MNNNYILARWRDAITDPPPGGWIGLNTMANGARYYGACGHMPGDQWLDITTVPGVAREAVQAAVDLAKLSADTWDTGNAIRHEYARGIRKVIGMIENYTGVTPTAGEPSRPKTLSEMVEAFKSQAMKPFPGFIYQFTQGDLDHLIGLIRGDSISRAQVMAAVDEIVSEIRTYKDGTTDDEGLTYYDALRTIERHTGVTPSGVKESLTTQEAPHA